MKTMTCYPMNAEYESGVRFIPVRRTDGRIRLDTCYVAESAAEALREAQLSDVREHHPEWVADNELVGVAEVDLRIVRFLTPSAIAQAELPSRSPSPAAWARPAVSSAA